MSIESPEKKTQPAQAKFAEYEQKFKALADQKRLQILFELCQKGEVCVCELCDIVEMQQSKLSYHLKILADAGLVDKETRGTWSYYRLNRETVGQLLSPALCGILTHAESACGCEARGGHGDDRQTQQGNGGYCCE